MGDSRPALIIYHSPGEVVLLHLSAGMSTLESHHQILSGNSTQRYEFMETKQSTPHDVFVSERACFHFSPDVHSSFVNEMY